jgi:periplasmic copper chaperone A
MASRSAGATVKFNPGSYHLMLLGLKKPIAKGPNVKGSLIFEKAGSVAIDYKIEDIGAMDSSDAGMGNMKMDVSKAMHDHMQ